MAGDIGPSGAIMAPTGTLDYAEAVDVFAEQAAALLAGGVDLIWIETMSDLAEIKAAIEGVRRVAPGIPLVATMTFDTRGHTMMGVSPEQAVTALTSWGADAVGGNCGNGPDELLVRRDPDAGRRRRRRCWSPSPTPGCPSWSTCGPSIGPIRSRWRARPSRCGRPARRSSAAAAGRRPNTWPRWRRSWPATHPDRRMR